MASTDTYHLKLTFFLSLTALPIIYLLNHVFASIDNSVRTFWMMVSGFVLLATISVIAYCASTIKDWVYFGMTLFAFTAVIDAVISLEYIGLTTNFMSEYLKLGEPYLLSPWGSAICAFDGIGFYVMYLLIVYLYTNNKSWRSVGIYWAAGLLNSMLVLFTGIFVGKHSPTFCTLLNIPYALFPALVLVKIFRSQNRSGWNIKIQRGIVLGFLDAFLAIGFLASIWIILAKTHTLLGSQKQLVLDTVKHDTALQYNDPAPFYSIQVFAYHFYILPIQIISVYFLMRSEKPQFLWEVTLVEAGAMLQAQFSYIVFSLDKETPTAYRANPTNLGFWMVNLIILIVPHLFLARLHLHRSIAKSNIKKNR